LIAIMSHFLTWERSDLLLGDGVLDLLLPLYWFRDTRLKILDFLKVVDLWRSGDWNSYHLQFTHTALRFEWTDAQKLDNVLLCWERRFKYTKRRLSCLDCRTLLEYFTLVESFNFLVAPKPPDCW
jgi:hypothetical protein